MLHILKVDRTIRLRQLDIPSSEERFSVHIFKTSKLCDWNWAIRYCKRTTSIEQLGLQEPTCRQVACKIKNSWACRLAELFAWYGVLCIANVAWRNWAMAYIQSSCSWTFTSSLLAAMPLTTLSNSFTLMEPAMRRWKEKAWHTKENALQIRDLNTCSCRLAFSQGERLDQQGHGAGQHDCYASIFGSAARVEVKPVQADTIHTIHTIHSYVKVGCQEWITLRPAILLYQCWQFQSVSEDWNSDQKKLLGTPLNMPQTKGCHFLVPWQSRWSQLFAPAVLYHIQYLMIIGLDWPSSVSWGRGMSKSQDCHCCHSC